ncbi:MAG: V-type ATP synthase subunit I [bacterium]|nr:V-type ATP synthase subunit I [bacterium]
MAVMKMKRVNICALRKHRKRILEALQHMGVMEIEVVKDDSMDRIETAPQKAVFERRKREAEQALEILDEYAPVKKGMFDSLNGKREIKKPDIDRVVNSAENIMSICESVRQSKESITNAQGRILSIKSELEALEPWLPCDIPMDYEGTLRTDISFGTVPASVTEEILDEAVKDWTAYYEIVSRDKNTKYLILVSLKECSEELNAKMRKLGFAKPAVTVRGTPAEHSKRLMSEQNGLNDKINELTKKIQSFASRRGDIEAVSDYYGVRAEKYGVLGTLMHTGKTFFITGYVPEKYAEGLRRTMEESFDAAAEVSDCGDDAPAELENSEFASSFEPVLESYGLPKKNEFDPSAIMGAFYVFLFGLMLSDAAYGLIISAACFFVLKKFGNISDGMRKSLRMFMYCGLSTLFWGVMFGGYFGDAVTVIAKTFFNKDIEIPALWFVPLKDPMRLLIYSMLFGLIHLFTGLGLKGYMYLRDKDVKGFVCDVLSWFMLLIGLLLILMQSSIYASLAGNALVLGSFASMAAKVMAAAGALIILFTAGRSSKNIGKRLAKGAYSLYDITSWLSDLLSYSRLLALGLATGVIAQVINQMGAMAGNGALEIAVFVIVFVVGHIFNLAINLLGAYVHTNRLQYVEFFGKFYEGGGRKFNPFRENTDFVKIKED